MVDLQVDQGSALLAAPSIALQYPLPQLAIDLELEAESASLGK
jgi:hypothetical protein